MVGNDDGVHAQCLRSSITESVVSKERWKFDLVLEKSFKKGMGYGLMQLLFKYTERIVQGFLDVEMGTAVIMVVRGRYPTLASEEVFAGD